VIALLLHLIGDYLTQSSWMALNKTKASLPALLHALVYSLPFLLIGSPQAVAVIFSTHFFIDRFRLARYVCFAKNFLAPVSWWPRWLDSKHTGYSNSTPEWLAVWLMIISDNTIHLLINTFALSHL
jgi:hypothetical protein